MIEIEAVTAAVGAIGFPIVAFYMMYQMCNNTLKDNTTATKELTQLIGERLK